MSTIVMNILKTWGALSLAFLLSLTATARAASVQPALPSIPDRSYVVTAYGAVGDGSSTNTVAIQKAISAADYAGGGTVVFPKGIFLSGPIQLADHVRLLLNEGAILRMLPLDKYPGGTVDPASFISGAGLHDIAISGSGTIDGQGIPWWPYARTRGAKRPRMIALSSCDRVLIEGVTLTNSPMFHIAIGGKSTNVTVRGVTIRANPSTDPVNPSHNTDACDVSGTNILIQDCDVSVGDDNFTCGGGTSDVLITNCTYGYGHGVSIGSHTAGGVSNITVINCTFNNTEQRHPHQVRPRPRRLRASSRLSESPHDQCGLSDFDLCLLHGHQPGISRAEQSHARHRRQLPGKRSPRGRRSIAISPSAISRPRREAGRRAGLIWGLPEAAITNVLLQKVNITADKPFGIYSAQAIRFVDSRILTPEGINKLSCTNAQVVFLPR